MSYGKYPVPSGLGRAAVDKPHVSWGTCLKCQFLAHTSENLHFQPVSRMHRWPRDHTLRDTAREMRDPRPHPSSLPPVLLTVSPVSL